jgi:hypothetical protein
MHAEAEPATSGYRDVTCSFCGRHNREVHMVGGRDGLTICTVCVARCAEIFDRDTAVVSPQGGWSDRWPAKQITEPNSGPAGNASREA